MSETQTINLKELTADIKFLNEAITKQLPETGPKGVVEESLHEGKEDLKTQARKAFREFLQSDDRKQFSVKEAIGKQTASAAIPMERNPRTT